MFSNLFFYWQFALTTFTTPDLCPIVQLSGDEEGVQRPAIIEDIAEGSPFAACGTVVRSIRNHFCICPAFVFSLRASFHFCIIFQSSLFRNLPHAWLHDARASAFAVQCARPTLSVPSSRSSRITWPSSKKNPFGIKNKIRWHLERVTCLLYD